VPLLQADLHAKVSDPSLNIIMQNHEYGVPPDHYTRWPVLGSFYRVLSTSKDRHGLEYIATIEGKKYPFTGGQGAGVGDGTVEQPGS
jgi:gamma-glutamyl hydrolase